MLPTAKLETLEARFHELEELLCVPEVIGDTRRYTSLRREHAELGLLTAAYGRFKIVEQQIADDRAALLDPELREMAEEEIPVLEAERAELEKRIEVLLLPSDPNDARNTILEIRSGTGGEEAALFAADLFRMYSRYAEKAGWKVEILSTSEASGGGPKEIVPAVTGDRG